MKYKRLTLKEKEELVENYVPNIYKYCENTSKKYGVSPSAIRQLLIRRGIYINYSAAIKEPNLNLKYKDLLGQKFNKLLVIENLGSLLKYKRTQRYWKCFCDCGNTKIVSTGSLLNKNTRSCGCLRKETFSKITIYNKLPDGEAGLNSLFYNLKKRSKLKNLEINISKEKYRELSKKNCYYCNSEPKQISRNRKDSTPYFYNGLDRIDNTKGYLVNNVVTCCYKCNRLKNVLHQDDFISHIKLIYNTLCLR